MGLTKPKPGTVKVKVSKQQRLDVPKTTIKLSKNQTDVILPTSDEWIQRILTGEKNFEFRKYLIPPTVERIWFYVKVPFSCIAYVCETEPGVCRTSPTFVPLPTTGFGNDMFNTNHPSMKGFDYAYYMKSTYVIEEPIHLDEMKKLYGIGCAPRGMLYVPKKMQKEVWTGEKSRLATGQLTKVFDRGKRKEEVKVTFVTSVVKKPAITRAESLMDVDMDAGGDTDVEDEPPPQQQQPPAFQQRPRLAHKRGRSSMSMDLSMTSVTEFKSRVKRQRR